MEAFAVFTDHERDSFLHAFEHEYGMRVLRLRAGQVICRKGDFELELCVVLKGRAQVWDPANESGGGPVARARLMAGRDARPTVGESGGAKALAEYEPGAIFGELGAMGGRPRSFDVVAAQETDILYIPRHALKYIEANPKMRTILAERYRELAVRTVTATLELFRTVPPSFITGLTSHCQIQRHDLRGTPIVRQGEPADGFYILLDGFVQVVREEEDGSRRVLAYLREGEYFGEMALLETGVRWASVFTAGKCELIKIASEDFLELCRRYPEAEHAIKEMIARRHQQEQTITPELSELLEKSGQLGVIQSDALLVMDLDLCIKCDNCVKACESLHGKSRLIRNGIQIGKYLVPSACRHCDDPKCMNACPAGAVKRRAEGEIYFQYDLCIGCGNCAIACPYDNITMIDTPSFDKAQARKARVIGDRDFFRPYPLAAHDADPGLLGRLFGRKEKTDAGQEAPPEPQIESAHVPPTFPIKCDLCDGLPFMGCVHSCPTGAAIRIEAAELFEQFNAVSAKGHIRKARDGE